MRKILVIGSGGAGKSTFSGELSQRLELPLIHLDALYWKPGWVETPRDQWRKTVEQITEGDSWVMDGNFVNTLDLRLAACDTVVFLDVSRWICLWRAIGRRVRFHGSSRPDMREGCPERLTCDFIRWIWSYPAQQRPNVLQKLAALDNSRQVYVLRSSLEITSFFNLL
jgi:adenylate kinase family enzyme